MTLLKFLAVSIGLAVSIIAATTPAFASCTCTRSGSGYHCVCVDSRGGRYCVYCAGSSTSSCTRISCR
jgi:hypothetical protein